MAADNEELFAKVAAALESQVGASLPFEIHVLHAGKKVLHLEAALAEALQKQPMPRG